MGVKLSVQRGHAASAPGDRTGIAALSDAARSGLDLCQNCADPLSGSRGLKRLVAMPEKSKLYTLLGDYPNTTALKTGAVTSGLVDFAFADVKVSNTAFKPLVRE